MISTNPGPGENLLRTARLLVVDDHQDNLELLTVLLGDRYRVSSCGSAVEAIRTLEGVQPDLLILDIGMTPVDGMECLRTIRAVPGYGSVPAIALTAFARDVEQEMFLGNGFQAVVTKPILDYDQLFSLIDRLLGSAMTPRDPCASPHSSTLVS